MEECGFENFGLEKQWNALVRDQLNGAEGDLNCGGLAQEVSEEKNVSMWPRDYSCDILERLWLLLLLSENSP